MRFNKRKKGSLTIEAVISFSIFVSFMFMLLSMVKISMVKITLDNAVSETAKYIATSSYPIGMFNDVAEDNDKSVRADLTTFTVGEKALQKDAGSLFDIIFADTEGEALKSAEGGIDGIINIFTGAGEDLINEVLFTAAENFISNKTSELAASAISEIIDNSYTGIDKNNLVVTIAKVPVPKQTYDYNYNTQAFTDMGLTKSDFNEDDVVIGVEYNYKLALPFITTIDVKMRNLAVEHGWVNGSSGNISKKTEGIKIDSLFEYDVYTTNTGHRYHKEDCFYLRQSRNKKTKSEAEGEGYTPCKRCSP